MPKLPGELQNKMRLLRPEDCVLGKPVREQTGNHHGIAESMGSRAVNETEKRLEIRGECGYNDSQIRTERQENDDVIPQHRKVSSERRNIACKRQK
ncbi:MAG: hypothetical protein K6C12_07995 [Oscillospiraceae bacterium]|nr:hypothetical protein [Oscillospiraceae bacterium]